MSSVMGRPAVHLPPLKLYLALNAAALFLAAVLLSLLATTGGFSLPRLLLVGVTAMLALAVAAAAMLLHFQPARERNLANAILRAPRRWGIILSATFLVFWCLTWFPPQYTGEAHYYFLGLYPLILCGLFASGCALLLILARRLESAEAWWTRYARERRPAIRVAIIALAAFGLVALLISQFRILDGHEPYWYGAGVPLLAAQVLTAVLIAALAAKLEGWSGTQRISADWILFAVIWIVAALIWAARPVPASYWITAPRPPNFEYYPFSDMITYDIASQFALIGQGIYNHAFFDRALYMSFLVYLHSIGGQDYQRLMSIQAAVFAVFPALLYLTGKDLHSRAAGLALAVLVTLRGLNSLDASAWIDTATFKHMLTDFPTAIGVAGFLLLIMRWMRTPHERRASLIWAGGVLGLTSLLRPHVLFLLAATVPLVLWVYRPRWRKALVTSALTVLAFLVAVLPWMALGPTSGSLVELYGRRFREVIAQRYPSLLPGPTLAPTSMPTPAVSASAVPTIEAAPPTGGPAVPTAAAEPVPPALIVKPYSPPPDPGPPFVVDHFLHNLAMSALVFPDTPQFQPVRDVVKEGEEFWLPRWSGAMSPLAALLLSLSLVSVAYGIGAAVQRDQMRGLVPMAVLVLYVTADSFARTSGGRYLVPVDWILVVYFSIAIGEAVLAITAFLRRKPVPELAPPPTELDRRGAATSIRGRRPRAPKDRVQQWNRRPWAILLFLLMLGGLVPLAGVLYPRRYAEAEPSNLIQDLQTYLPQAGSAQELEAFLQQPNAAILRGRILYPLFYHRDDGEPTRYAPYTARGYPRTVFILIEPHGMLHVILPGGRPALLPNAADAIVLGCTYHEQSYVMMNALSVVLPDQQSALTRSPAAPLKCPLPDPVCDNNGNCH